MQALRRDRFVASRVTDLQNEWAMTPLHAIVLRLAESDPVQVTNEENNEQTCALCDAWGQDQTVIAPGRYIEGRELVHESDCRWMEARRLVSRE